MAALAPAKQLEDPLAHLPRSNILAYRKGQPIYNHDVPATSIFLVIDGKVKVSEVSTSGRRVIIEIYQQDELFGESALLPLAQRNEEASALEASRLMTWTAAAIEDLVMNRPQLALALLQVMTQRTLEFTRRIEEFSTHRIHQRLASCLLRFSERWGSLEADGSVRIEPLTHEVLAGYVGTSREIVTQYMNEFRRDGYLQYSRKGINLYRDALRGRIIEGE
jgi:CRP/FNR family transcriptional regulator, cyclic AMP receptor protein